MVRSSHLLLLLAFIAALTTSSLKAQGIKKKITITAVDAVTGKPVEGAEVTFKALLGKLVKKTDRDGKAVFDAYMLTKTMNWNYTVKYPNSDKTYKAYAGTVAMVDTKDNYEDRASLQPDLRRISFKVADARRQPLQNATVKLKDDKGNELTSQTDANGVASFDVAPSSNYTNATLAVVKEGFNEYTVPVSVDAQTSQVAVVAPLTEKQVMIVDNGTSNPTTNNTPKPKNDMLGPTDNTIQTSLPPGYFSKPQFSVLSWGPYDPECDANPLASVPTFTPLSVEDEKTLLDNLASSCLGSADDAVNALVEATENIVNVSTRLQAAWSRWSDVVANNNASQIVQVSEKAMGDTKKIVEEEKDKTKKAITDAIDKTKELLSNIKSLGEGPEVFVLSCMWDGIKDYAIPDDITKVKKSAESFGKLKKGLQDKMDSIAKLVASDKAFSVSDKSDKNLFTDWGDIIGNVQKTAGGLNIILSWLKDPRKILPYETQVNLAISSAESMMATLMTDCQTRECDRQIKQGVAAAQAALTAARKLYAQKTKGESKWRSTINDFVSKNYDASDRGWEYMAPDDYRLNAIRPQWETWARYHNEAIDADKQVKKFEGLLNKLADLCNKLQPIAATLNERVSKYGHLYVQGLTDVENCKLDEAEKVLRQMQTLEQSDCGHFFPRPFGKAQSEELSAKIQQAKQSGKCKEDFGGPGWELVSLVVDPDKKSGKWSDSHNVTITENSVTATAYKSQLTLTISSPPKFIKDGDVARIDVAANYAGNDNVFLTFNMNAYLGLTEIPKKVNQYNVATMANVSVGRGDHSVTTTSHDVFVIGKQTFGMPPDSAIIEPQVFVTPFFNGPRIFRATYKHISGDKLANHKKPQTNETTAQSKKIKEVSEKNFENITGIPSKYGVFKLVEDGIKPTGTTVVGKFPDYVNKAKQLNASSFVIGGKWDELAKDGYDPWKANQYFLDRIADLRQKVVLELGGKPLDGFTGKEVNYLTEQRGYKWSTDGKTLIPAN